MCSPLTSSYSSCLHFIVVKSFFMRLVEIFLEKEDEEIFIWRVVWEAYIILFEEDQVIPSWRSQEILQWGPYCSVNRWFRGLRSTTSICFSMYSILQTAGIYEDFMRMITNVGLQTFMGDTRTQYSRLANFFVESFKFNCKTYNPTVEFKIYDCAYIVGWKIFAGL